MNIITNTDKRYSINLEWCGESKPKFILRFCDDWVSKHNTKQEAIKAANYLHYKS